MMATPSLGPAVAMRSCRKSFASQTWVSQEIEGCLLRPVACLAKSFGKFSLPSVSEAGFPWQSPYSPVAR